MDKEQPPVVDTDMACNVEDTVRTKDAEIEVAQLVRYALHDAVEQGNALLTEKLLSAQRKDTESKDKVVAGAEDADSDDDSSGYSDDWLGKLMRTGDVDEEDPDGYFLDAHTRHLHLPAPSIPPRRGQGGYRGGRSRPVYASLSHGRSGQPPSVFG